MIVASLRVNGAYADTQMCRPITAGTIGAQVQFLFEKNWETLSRTVVFRGCVTKDVVNVAEIATIPAEVVAQPCDEVLVGIYGVNGDGTLAIPTIWTSLGPVYAGADPSGDETTDPSLPVWAQLAAQVDGLKQRPMYYVPQVRQQEEGSMTVEFSPSQDSMPAVSSATVVLPAGKTPEKGIDYATEADKEEMVARVLAALPVYHGEEEDI